MIELHNVTKYFRVNEYKRYILKDVNITLPDSNIGILGKNGAGKSTLMRMLGKIEFPSQGTIFSTNSFSWPLGLGGGFVGNMSAKDNIKFVCKLYGKTEKETKDIIVSVRKFSDIGKYFDMPIKTYSSGMKGRVGFGLSLSFNFDYMIIDETLSVGDASFKDKAKKALREKIKTCHVLLVSHDMQTLRDICQSGLLVHEGELFYYEDINEAISHYNKINKEEK